MTWSRKGLHDLSLEERFIRFIEPITETGCWLWTGYVCKDGYGRFNIPYERKSINAHRISYEIYRGGIADGLDIDHLCRVRCCVNPYHLECVTRRENIKRGNHDYNKFKTHCLRGHELNANNVYLHSGRRHCRICKHLRYVEIKNGNR